MKYNPAIHKKYIMLLSFNGERLEAKIDNKSDFYKADSSKWEELIYTHYPNK